MITLPGAEWAYLEKDLNDELRLFDGDLSRPLRVKFRGPAEGERAPLVVTVEGRAFSFDWALPAERLHRRRLWKRAAMAAVYRYLRDLTGRRFPYGAFTGIRPTKQFVQVENEGLDPRAFCFEVLDMAPEKVGLVEEIVREQRPCRATVGPRDIDLYVGIPFCRGRCAYCSFISCNLNERPDLEDPYVDALLRELEGVRPLLTGRKVRSVYVGGGTPSALSKRNVRRLLEALAELKTPEFTFEAGRPDSIDEELLELCASCGVNRISVNPQSANDETLRAIGRRHTFAETVAAYRLARRYPLAVNMDLIMGLGEERAEDFLRSVRAVVDLAPDNVTVHALALKKGSVLKEQGGRAVPDAEEMSTGAHNLLAAAGYRPYYLYRQKYSAGNLENVGYARPGTACVYNIDNMEELASVLALGANAISKRVWSGEERIERQANPKDIPTYLDKTERILADKAALFGGSHEI